MKPVCRACGAAVLYGNLYCSHRCGEGKVSYTAERKALESRGFSADSEINNVYLKDGVALTLEHIAHVGLSEALIQHAAVCAIRDRAGISDAAEIA